VSETRNNIGNCQRIIVLCMARKTSVEKPMDPVIGVGGTITAVQLPRLFLMASLPIVGRFERARGSMICSCST
jgi:hypothetical protein